jgi:membrane protein implicated in regulation of membrane protease activity
MAITAPVALLLFAVLLWALVLVAVLPLLAAWGSRDKHDRRGSRQDWAGD